MADLPVSPNWRWPEGQATATGVHWHGDQCAAELDQLRKDRDELVAALEEAVEDADDLTMEYHWSEKDDARQARFRALITRIRGGG